MYIFDLISVKKGVFFISLFLFFSVAGSPDLKAQDREEPDYAVDPSLFQQMKWRNIGPFRGGRATTAAGHAEQPLTYYMGATGGGVWKTVDAGQNWKNISDGFFNTGSVGAIDVADSDPNVVFAGMGESPIRGVKTSFGDGVYKSTDAGKTWTHLGLDKSRHISSIQIHPENPDILYVAAQGNAWAPNPERGVYRSTDGGKTWEKSLFVNDSTGAVDLKMDVTNPRILYAAMWDHQRTPWHVRSGGPGSAIYKTTDGGESWEKLEKGLPELMGKIGVAVSPADPERVWAIVEAEKGGLFRSDNGGKSWKNINKERVLRARSWYYMHIFAHPTDPDEVYVLNAPLMKSTDGGKNFTEVGTPHGDNHYLWINPEHPEWMINANDGGANVSNNGGKSWSTQSNQPTAQFYRVNADDLFPYRVYGGQQDNSTVGILSRTMKDDISREDWFAVGGGESAFVAFNKDDPHYIYAGSYHGLITEYNSETNTSRNVKAYPSLGLASIPRDLKYRFNWNAPIVVSQHNPEVIYQGAQVVLKSDTRGNAWSEISPDLTRNEKEKQGPGGVPITNEGAGGEVYNTISYIEESPHEAGVIWAGSDDGLIHLTRDGGQTWNDVTPKGLPESIINAIDVSPHDPARAYAAVMRYKLGDFAPYIYKTDDYGESWNRIDEGLPEEGFVRVVREDTARKGLLYAGSELGLFVSFDEGSNWQPLKLNLPMVPITDLLVKGNDLVAATQGRAFWILDDLEHLRQVQDNLAEKSIHLFKPENAYWTEGGQSDSRDSGQNPKNGILINYYLSSEPDTAGIPVGLEIRDSGNKLIRQFASKAYKKDHEDTPFHTDEIDSLKKGTNQVVWDMNSSRFSKVPDLMMLGGYDGYKVSPGKYTAVLTGPDGKQEQTFEIEPDPRIDLSEADFGERERLLRGILSMVNEVHASVNQINAAKEQVAEYIDLLEDHPEADTLTSSGKTLNKALDEWVHEVVQPDQKTFQDVINFPNRINAELLYLKGMIEESHIVTESARSRFKELRAEWNGLKKEKRRLVTGDLGRFLDLFETYDISPVVIPKGEQ